LCAKTTDLGGGLTLAKWVLVLRCREIRRVASGTKSNLIYVLKRGQIVRMGRGIRGG